jgi:hypothetical protein
MKRSNSQFGFVLLCVSAACGSDSAPTRGQQQLPIVANQGAAAASTPAGISAQPTAAIGAAGVASTPSASSAGHASSEFPQPPISTGVAGVGIPAVAGSGSSMQASTMGWAGASTTPPKAGTSALPAAGAPAAPGGTKADVFCDKYGMYCGYAKPNRHADRAACLQDFNATPVQQGCKTMHLDTAIAGTAAACNGMASEFCFSIHCLHAAGITDPTGTTYCK